MSLKKKKCFRYNGGLFNSMFWKEAKSNKKEFYSKKSYIDRRLENDVMEDGKAYIPCKVTGIDDIISKLSVKNCETLDFEFLNHIIGFAEVIPAEYPVVLEIRGPEFSSEEQKTITETISSEMNYILGKTEQDNRRLKRRFIGMIVGTIASSIILISVRKYFSFVPLEFLYVLFWLFADAVVRYLFIEKLDFKKDKIKAGRMASMKIEFVVKPD